MNPSLIDLVMKFVKENLPDCEIACIHRYGSEIFIDGRCAGAIIEQSWHQCCTTYENTKWHYGIHASDPNFFDVIIEACRLAAIRPWVIKQTMLNNSLETIVYNHIKQRYPNMPFNISFTHSWNGDNRGHEFFINGHFAGQLYGNTWYSKHRATSAADPIFFDIINEDCDSIPLKYFQRWPNTYS